MTTTLAEFQAAGFPMAAEPVVALDLVDTLMLVTDTDHIGDETKYAKWWELQADRLPDVPPPPVSATRRLRSVLRELFDAALAERTPDQSAIEDLNAFSAGAPTSPRLEGWGEQAQLVVRWHDGHDGHPALAAIAGGAIGLLSDPAKLSSLRRCANPACSMLFLAENKRRVWCTANLCGNRARVARHYERTRG
ncbi:CGNR zinc finger domain-containing protein [Lentzea aerocolonigenes]|nr:ABATE domain-containing protein [Lentzea aerocolonigenes]